MTEVTVSTTVPTGWHDHTDAHQFTAEQVLTLVRAAYERGRFDAEINDLRGTWAEHPEPRATRETRIAERMAEMSTYAERVNRERGRHPRYRYRGGPVDWDTGLPHRSACAWAPLHRVAPPARVELARAA